MQSVINSPRLDQLKELLLVLAKEIDDEPGARDMASLVKQYRETIKEIEEIEGSNDEFDEIEEILNERQVNGKSGAVRKSKPAV
jgi:hypothetical protein